MTGGKLSDGVHISKKYSKSILVKNDKEKKG